MFGSLAAACTGSEWSVNPDDCERRNLDDYFKSEPKITGPAAPMRTVADLQQRIRANNGTLYVWTANVNTTPELQIAKANPTSFKVTAVAGDPGTYAITESSLVASITSALAPKPVAGAPSQSSLTTYLPYILLGGGALVVLSLLKK